MHQPEDKEKDIFIPLGKFQYYDFANKRFAKKHLYYNVSQFLRLHDSDEYLAQVANADKVVHLLDTKVHIDTSNQKYAHIYQGTDTIVKRVVAGLSKLDSYFTECKLRQTGSCTSGVKVGLPHESDYVLETPRDRLLQTGKPFDKHTLFPLVQQTIAKQAVVLTDRLDGSWIIHGVEKHRRTGGVALVMQCLSSTNDFTIEEVGVTVDLVPVHIREYTTKSFTAKAEAFLHHSLAEYVEKGDLYCLPFGRDDSDTGFIENTIMKQLPEDTKQAFRVAKFLISHFCVSPYIQFAGIETLDKETRLRLYGRKPWISSYHLRILLFLLLIHVHGTEAEQRLTGGLLVACLFDMLKQCREKYQKGEPSEMAWFQTHPLLMDADELLFYLKIPLKPFMIIKDLMEKKNPADVVEQMCLWNNKNPIYGFHSDDSDSDDNDSDD